MRSYLLKAQVASCQFSRTSKVWRLAPGSDRRRCRGLTRTPHCAAPTSEPAPPSSSGKSGQRPLVIATRPSKLAKEQTRQVQQLLLAAAQLKDEQLQLSTLELASRGDTTQGVSLRSLGSGAFTEELDQAVLSGAADMSVHSLKDCPAALAPGLLLAACLPRADPRDVLIAPEATSLGELVPGSRVGTSSSRRAAQIKHSFPHLQVVQLRGNVDSRLGRIRSRDIGATVLAAAGLKRLGVMNSDEGDTTATVSTSTSTSTSSSSFTGTSGEAGSSTSSSTSSSISREGFRTSVLSTEEMLPAACQGAVGVVCRADDEWVVGLLDAISHRGTALEVAAERACLAALLGGGGACQRSAFPDIAWACHTRHDPDSNTMDLDCLVADLEGKELFRYTEFYRPVIDEVDAVSLGSLYGSLLRMMAVGQGWLQEEDEEEAAAAGEEEE
ncbi:hypothetical protein CHLRE_02g113850v5 [Chlamydomonas reinhardtii]|uniref:hydroxymethylbilane synthase n=1 Tax=Chlamydomonas reinhardtii TaxID=3055 RepID=A0A2K3E393_CHLRE|nr:uncharacterized protein CHLRE_02g113850v5 [Chlamydomonas reinhardtii]PNW87223.1 hypothetical protein CHLRE_02g113850v5 [Chlamydomonas reinhardtii]